MSMTGKLQRTLSQRLPYEELLPEEQPAYVHNYVYLFGVATLCSFALLIATGVILAAFGPQWWHSSNIGHFVNSLHYWAAQAFMFFMVLHLWTAFFQGAWRDGRGLTWVSGVLTFLISIVTAFTGYLSQQNFDSQWIATQAKDAMNSVGAGAFFNVLNFGQMYGFHVVIFPVIVSALLGTHLTLVRMKGVVKPYDLPTSRARPAPSAAKPKGGVS
jgi:quinol-cytochrome oxidoreductase complex cytochrome b subunit